MHNIFTKINNNSSSLIFADIVDKICSNIMQQTDFYVLIHQTFFTPNFFHLQNLQFTMSTIILIFLLTKQVLMIFTHDTPNFTTPNGYGTSA